MSVRVAVRPGCNGMGSCARLAPQVFSVNPQTGVAEVLVADATAWEAAVRAAAGSCPFIAVEVDGQPLDEPVDDVVVAGVEQLTPDIIALRLRRPGFVFIPGQYVFLRLEDGAGRFFRTYSVVESRGGLVTLCIRLVPNGRAAKVLAGIRPGSEVGLTRAKGLFALRTPDRPKLFVSGGTGLAPVLAMCEAAPRARKLVVVGARSEGELFWLDRLRAIPGTEVLAVVQNPGPTWQGPTGLVTAPLETLDVAAWPEVYTCGSPEMVEAVRKALVARGVPAASIDSDAFLPAGLAPAGAAAGAVAAAPGRDWPGLLRRMHYIASAPLALIILFYALTGFIANRSALFEGEGTGGHARTLPAGASLERERLAPVLAAMLPGSPALASFSEGPPITASFTAGERGWLVQVDGASRAVSIAERGILPEGTPFTAEGVASALRHRLSGEPDLGNATADDESVDIEFGSVWGTHRVEARASDRSWTAITVTPPLVVSLVDLHRGKHAGAWQRVIVDATAAVLALVTLSGAGMALMAAAPKRRRLAMILLGSGVLLLLALLFAR